MGAKCLSSIQLLVGNKFVWSGSCGLEGGDRGPRGYFPSLHLVLMLSDCVNKNSCEIVTAREELSGWRCVPWILSQCASKSMKQPLINRKGDGSVALKHFRPV